MNKSGFLLVNKPVGPTSHDIIDKLRKITSIKKIGHAGTLDPFASGLLIIAIGRGATREMSQFVKLEKIYKARLYLGATSDTYDRMGKIIKIQKDEKIITKENIVKILKQFEGEQYQIPPMFSAKKIKGKKLYELARQGKEVEREAVKININYIKLLKYNWPYLDIETMVSSGTYIRSLAYDIGQKLSCGAYLEELERTEVGKYKLINAVNLDKLTEKNWNNFLI